MRYIQAIALFAGWSCVFAQPAQTKKDTEKPAAFGIEQAIALRPITDLQFSPDGHRLAFTVSRAPKDSTREQEIWMLNVQSRKTWRFAHSRKSSRIPRWSPDGSELAFVSDREERAQIYVMPADGGEAEGLTSGKNAVVSFEWSPKGDSIAFLAPEAKTEAEEKKEKDKDDAHVVEKDDKPVRLWVIEKKSKKVRQISAGNWQIAEFKWAPLGDRLFAIAVVHPEPLVWRKRVLSVSLADGATKEIAAPDGPVTDLQISPDGKVLSFLGSRGDGPSPHDLFVLAVDGGTARNLTEKPLDRPLEESPQGFIKSSPMTHLKNAKTPTLILHPENDLTDPIGQAQQLHRGLKHVGVECELVIYPREGHGPQEEKHLLDINRRLLGWFETHLK
jgi:dipeptidyl aminopeptidase/acylaminoacyl peptidase